MPESQNIEINVKRALEDCESNPFGEKVTVVGAIKYQSVEAINRAIAAGLKDIGDNHVQEFREKYAAITAGARRHFIGHLQTNKIKYLIGKVDLYQSVDRLNLAEELSKRSEAAGVESKILIQINIGKESSKGGFEPDMCLDAYKRIVKLPALKCIGLMAMMPLDANESQITCLAKQMRKLYDDIRAYDGNFICLSMGMSGDYKTCVSAGSNMVRLGTSLFGARNYD